MVMGHKSLEVKNSLVLITVVVPRIRTAPAYTKALREFVELEWPGIQCGHECGSPVPRGQPEGQGSDGAGRWVHAAAPELARRDRPGLGWPGDS